MDIFAHFLWTFAIYWKHPRRWVAGLIGVLPDLFAFVPFFAYGIATGTRAFGPMAPSLIPQWVYTLYAISHSLVIFAVVAFAFWLFLREWFWLLGGWLLHILIDIPSHSFAFFPTPFLWPLSDAMFNGLSWGTWWFMLINYSALAAVYAWLLLKVPGPQKSPKPRAPQG